MISVENADFVARVGIPDMHSTISGATKYKLGVWTEAGLNGYPLIVKMACEGLQRGAMESINESDDAAVGGYQDGLAVPAELEACPVALLLLGELEVGEGALVEATQVVELDGLGVDARGEYEAFGVVGGDRPPGHVHDAVAVGRAQVPEPQRLVEGA